MVLVFSKALVLQAIKEAGNEDKVTQDMIDDLNFLDGKPVTKSGWDDLVYDRLMYLVKDRNGKTIKVEPQFVEER